MSKASTLTKLQTLLERVRARSSMPRNGQAGPAAAAATIEVEPAPPLTPAIAMAPPVASIPQPPPVLHDVEEATTGAPTLPPSSVPLDELAVEEISVDIEVGEPETAAPPPLMAAAPASAPREVSISEPPGPLPFESVPAPAPEEPLPFESAPPPPVPPLAIPEGPSPAASESAERLVAADRVGSESPVEIVVATPPPPAPPIEAKPVSSPAPIEPEVERTLPPLSEEPPAIPAAPASSRRPVAAEPEEHLAEMAFGSEEPAQPLRHTPPPESGRLPAGPAEEFDADVTGVRSAPHSEPTPLEEERSLSPIAIRAPLPPSDAVAHVAGAPSFEPATFLAWLDATLGL